MHSRLNAYDKKGVVQVDEGLERVAFPHVQNPIQDRSYSDKY